MGFLKGRNEYENLDEDSPTLPLRNFFCWSNFRPSLRSVLILAISFTAVVVSITLIATYSTGTEDSDQQLLQQQAPSENETTPTPITTVTIRINDGQLRGKVLQSRGGRNYSAFYNIPYATPPVGQLRFEPPQKFTDGWRGIRDATIPGERCAQKKIGSDEVKGSEDCLYLSVFTPNLPTTRSRRGGGRRNNEDGPLPVMVYFFGGAFIGGYASGYSADYLMDSDIVLVLPEYRVGSLGNLNTEDPSSIDGNIGGNMGFKDQVMVLRWVQENIGRFSGNSSKVTICGNSSGGMSVHAHLFSGMSAGLFHRAISQSGSALGLNCVDIRARERAQDIAKKIGCAEEQLNVTSQLVACLKEANVSDILSAQNMDLTGLTVEVGGVEGEVFLADTPLNLLQSGAIVSDVPWILGANSGEMGMMAMLLNNTDFAQQLNGNWSGVAPALLGFDTDPSLSSDEVEGMVGQVREFYFGKDKNISLAEHGQDFGNMMSDRQWVHPTWAAARLYAKTASSPVYLYWLTYEEMEDRESGKESYGVSHAAEVKYLFPFSKYPYIGVDGGDYNFSRTMVDIWTSFASREVEEGVPFFVGDLAKEWTPLGKGDEGVDWLRLDEQPEMMVGVEAEGLGKRMRFWDGFEPKSLYVWTV